jgi:hypothetical protein
MTRTVALLTFATLAFVAFAAMPNASAASSISVCSGSGVGDRDGDGLPETSNTCTSPPCGCNCPAVGEGVELAALGQDVKATAIVGCGYYLSYGADPGDVDWDGPVTPTLTGYCYGAGLPQLCNSISFG